MATLGKLEYLISVDKSGLKSGLSSAESTVKGFGNKMSSWAVAKGQVLGRLIEQAGKATLSFVKNSVSESRAFDKSISQVAATLGKTTAEVQDLAKFARKMGAETAFTAQEAAEGLNYMALAGYDTQKSMRMLPQVLNLAAAGNFDLARASDMVTDAQSALGLSIEGTEAMIDQMALAASKTNTSVEQLGDAILTIGGTGKQLKGGTEELAVALGVLADNGIKGSEGGTALRNVLMRLTAPTDKAAKQLKDLGVDAFDSQGNLRELQEIFLDFNEVTSAKTMKERSEIFSKIFNVRDLKSVEALIGTSAERWQELYEAMGGSKGAAARMAETQLDNLEGDVTKLKSALGEAKLSLVEGLTPELRRFAQSGTKIVQRLTNAFKKKGLRGAIEEAGEIFSKFIENLKKSDNPVLQKVGSALEKVKNVGNEVWGLITNFPGKIKEWKESDSPGLNALATVLEGVRDTIDTITIAFNDGIPAAIEHLNGIDSPLSNLAAGALQTLYDVCNFFIENVGLEGTITGIAVAFGLFKSIQVSSSLLELITKLRMLAGMKNLKDVANILNGGEPPTTTTSGGEAPTTSPTTGGVKPVPWYAKLGAGLKNFWQTGGGMSMLTPAAVFAAATLPAEFVMNQTRQKWSSDYNRRMNASQLPSDNAQFISEAAIALGTNGQVDWDKAENLLMGLAKRQNKQKAELYNLLKDSTTAGDNTWNLLNKFWEGAELDPNQINEMLQNITDAFADEAVSMPVDPEVDLESAQSQLDGAGLSAPVQPKLTGFLGKWFGHAKGLHRVPYDNYPALLHRDEEVLSRSQARRYRDGEGERNVNIPSLIAQSVKESMKQVNFLLNGDKVADLTSKRTKKNINASSYSRIKAYGGA